MGIFQTFKDLYTNIRYGYVETKGPATTELNQKTQEQIEC